MRSKHGTSDKFEPHTPPLETAYQLSQEFVMVLAERQEADRDTWLTQAEHKRIVFGRANFDLLRLRILCRVYQRGSLMDPQDRDILSSPWHFLAQSPQDTKVYNRIRDAHVA